MAEVPRDAASSTSPRESSSTTDERRGRRSRPKVKTGCSNCKQRRIKCDEVRPACSQCVRSHKQCTGYPPPSRHAVSYTELRIAPKPADSSSSSMATTGPALAASSATSTSSTISSSSSVSSGPATSSTILLPRRRMRRQRNDPPPAAAAHHVSPTPTLTPPPSSSSSVALSATEAAYFDLFRTQTAPELSGYFDVAFWTRSVPQACHSEPAVRHAAAALGALYMTLEQSSRSPSPPVSPSSDPAVLPHWHVAVRQYSDACNAVVALGAHGQSSSSHHRPRLMASVLLGCFDAFIGDHRQAIVQVQAGIGLLNRLRSEPNPDPVEEDLVTIFTRLAIQAKSYDLAFHFPEPYVVRLNLPDSPTTTTPPFTPVPPLDRPFPDLHEARLAYDHIVERSLRVIEVLRHVQQHQPSSHTSFPPSWRDRTHGFHADLAAWAHCFQPLLDARLDPSSPLTPVESSAVAALKISQVNSSVLLVCLFDATETQFDACGPQFRQIVDLAAEVVEPIPTAAASHPDGGRSRGSTRPTIAADMGVVAPLFVVATKCREPSLRRRAVHLLRRSARREGMWDSELSALMAEWVMRLEEDAAAGHPDGGGYIPEECRVTIHSVDFDLRARHADLVVGPRGGGGPALQGQGTTSTRIAW